MRAWNTSSRRWRLDLTLRGHEDAVGALSVWGSFLVSGSSDSTVRLWDLSQGMVEDPDGGGGGGGGDTGGQIRKRAIEFFFFDNNK